jgi:battenin
VYEGLLGGATYVNAYINITEEVAHNIREFSLGVVGVADTTGIALAAATSLALNRVLAPFATPR